LAYNGSLLVLLSYVSFSSSFHYDKPLLSSHAVFTASCFIGFY